MAITKQYPEWILEKACPYKNCYLSFLDIMGFKELVLDEKNSHKIAAPFYALQDMFYDPNKNSSASKMSLALISDTIVMSADARITNVVENVISISVSLIREFWEEGILLRGAITYGKIFHDGNIVYGPALVQAYELEKARAKYPRVIVTDEFYNQHLVNHAFQDWFIDGGSSIKQLDFLGSFMSNRTEKSAHLDLVKGKNWIQDCLRATVSDDHVHEKYTWLQHEWNKSVRNYVAAPEKYLVV